MRALRFALPLAACLLMAAGPAAPLIEEFDVPAMPGLAERTEQRLTFDRVDGRILQTLLEGRVEAKRVRAYYRQALPPLGWAYRGKQSSAQRLVFTRGPERLVLDLGKPGQGVLPVRLLIEPDEPANR
jgi:hypothetical protein